MIVEIVALLLGVLTAFYLYMTRKFGYFSSRGVVEVPPVFPFGSEQHKRMVSGKVSFITSSETIYKQYRHERMVGHYAFDTPNLLVNDLELAKAIMIKDFDHFVDRRSVTLNTDNPINKVTLNMMTFLKGDKWKFARSTLSPLFTSGKLKSMTGFINKAGEDLEGHMLQLAEQDTVFSAKAVMTDYTLDIIASCGFGIEANAFDHKKENRFREMAASITGQGKRSFKSVARLLTIISFPKLSDLLKLSFFEKETINFFVDLVRRTMEQRRKENVRKNDLIDLSLDALNDRLGQSGDGEEQQEQFERDAFIKPNRLINEIPEEELELMLVANIIQLFLAGYETTSTIMAVALFHLAKNPDVQERLKEEISEAFESSKDFDYYEVQRLPYLDQVLHEAARMYPLTVVERECVRDYPVPGSSFVVPKGMLVQIPTLAIMQDERYFPDPERFDPEHFSQEKKATRSPYAYLAFGQGPRNCLGMRFAMLQMKIALVKIIRTLKVIPCEKTVETLVPDPISRSHQPKGGIWLKVEKRNNSTPLE